MELNRERPVCPKDGSRFVPGKGPICPGQGSCLSRTLSRPKCLCLLFFFLVRSKELQKNREEHSMSKEFQKPQPLLVSESTAVRLQFVRQCAPHLYRCTSLTLKRCRKGSPTVRLPFILQYASHLYGSTLPICTAVLLRKYWGLGSPESF